MADVELLIVGSVALDTVETRWGRHERILGGSASFAGAASAFFTRPEICAVIGEDFPEAHLDFLRSRGVGLGGLERAAGKTFFWNGRYAPDFKSRETLETQLNVFADFRPRLPPPLRKPRFLFLGNIHPSLQLEVLSQVERPRLTACDTMNLWISTTPKELRELLARVDVVLLNDEEVLQLSGEHDLLRATRAVLAMGPGTIVVKRGDAGALLFHDERLFVAPAFPLDKVVDPTGAGDSFAGGFMGALAALGTLGNPELRMAMIVGSTIASFAVEDFSLDRFRRLTVEEIQERYAAFRELTEFPDLGHLLPAGAR
ncbi:MAG: sugar kinase [Deltaproteobacteria bacterium]|nr:sugar kinase [Deltaproteobacteria bacterium]